MKRYSDQVFDKIKIVEDINFANMRDSLTGDDYSLGFDIYMPEEDSETKRRALILIHGGGFVSGNKKQEYIVTLAKFFTKLGYVTVSPDYHLHTKENRRNYKFAALNTVADLEALRSFLIQRADEYGIDTDNMAVCGGSAGGMLANELYKIDGAYRAFFCLWGAPAVITEPQKYTPTLLVHGTADKLVSYDLSVSLLNELTENGVYCELITLEDAGHTAIDRRDEFLPRAVDFLNEYMK